MIPLILFLLFFLIPRPVSAVYDPLSVPNNTYGIHIADFNDIADVAPLVNSSGGDWGYITLVASDSDRDKGRWQSMFDQMRRLHLIPLVRLATHPASSGWVKPNPGTFDELVTLFHSLNWPTENRYIILYNEPNHANEWGGTLDPEGYANVSVELAKKFKQASPDFFMLPAGLDVSAASDGSSMDAAEYWRRMIAEKPDFLTIFDGWTSHSYPNPAFSGSPYASGRGTIQSFDWELSYLRSLGLSRDLPVFITETGWTHNQGKVTRGLLSPEAVGANLQIAAGSVWVDKRIVAVTPFLFNYQDMPFDNFSWKRLGNQGFYSQYGDYQSITKIKGLPKQKEEYVLSESLLPETLVTDSSYTLSTNIINKGQGILDPNNGYEISLDDANKGFTLVSDPLPTLEPNERGKFVIHLKTPQESGTYRVTLILTHGNMTIPLQTRDILLVPPPSIRVAGQLGWRHTSDTQDVTVLIYDHDTLVHKFTGLSMANGSVNVSDLSNIVPGKHYRVVLLVPSYLPRQAILPLSSNQTIVRMKRLYPFDLDKDGKLTIFDIWTLLTKPPHNMLGLFLSP